MEAEDDEEMTEPEKESDRPDPDAIRPQNRRLVTNPYDLVISSLIDQIKDGTLHLRPVSGRPNFQRRYVWSNKLASRLIESILLNVPIPPCYMSQNDEFELDIIDGQQRVYSIYRFLNNEFKLSGLDVYPEFNGKRFFEIDAKSQRKLKTYTLRCIVVSNESHPDIKFDVFERLNTSTMPLNPQELRNCIFRGPLIELLEDLAAEEVWLKILNRKKRDQRMKGEELVLRFFAFQKTGVKGYKTPQKHWLNEVARDYIHVEPAEIDRLRDLWHESLAKSLLIFKSDECFRRVKTSSGKRNVVNRALMDLTLYSMTQMTTEEVRSSRKEFRKRYRALLLDEEFEDLITRAIDHRSRVRRRFELWKKEYSRIWFNADMARFTHSYSAFINRLDEIDTLIALARQYTHLPPTPSNLLRANSICRAGIVLLSSHIEGYVKDLGELALDKIVVLAVRKQNLGNSFRYHLSRSAINRIKDAKDPKTIESCVDDFLTLHSTTWDSSTHFTSALPLEELLTGFANPKFDRIAKFFKKFGYEEYKKDLARELQGDFFLCTNLVDNLVDERNNIAHGDFSTSGSPTDLRQKTDMAKKLCRATDKVVATWFKGIGCVLRA